LDTFDFFFGEEKHDISVTILLFFIRTILSELLTFLKPLLAKNSLVIRGSLDQILNPESLEMNYVIVWDIKSQSLVLLKVKNPHQSSRLWFPSRNQTLGRGSMTFSKYSLSRDLHFFLFIHSCRLGDYHSSNYCSSNDFPQSGLLTNSMLATMPSLTT